MAAVLEALEVRAHVLGAPRRIAGEIRELVPVRVVRVDEDHRVVRGAAAERAGARVQHAVDALAVVRVAVLRVAPLLLVVVVVADEEVPAQRVVLGRERMKGRDVVVVGSVLRRRLRGSPPSVRGSPPASSRSTGTRFGEPGGDGAAAGAGADDDVVGVVAIGGGAAAGRPAERLRRRDRVGEHVALGDRRAAGATARGAQHQPGLEEVAALQRISERLQERDQRALVGVAQPRLVSQQDRPEVVALVDDEVRALAERRASLLSISGLAKMFVAALQLVLDLLEQIGELLQVLLAARPAAGRRRADRCSRAG